MAAKTAGTWQVFEPVGVADLTNVDTTAAYPLGFRCKAKDKGSTDYGYAEFIYLKGVGSTARGSVVLVKDDYSTSLLAAKDRGAVAVALAAVDATTKYGWYQTRGKAVVTCDSGIVAANPMYIDTTAGQVDDTAVTGDQVIGMRANSTDDTGTCVVTMGVNPAVADFDNT